jgi:galactokinase
VNSLEGLGERFRQAYGREPDWLVRAPGRVNLIGEHTDYNQGFVLPMAIDRFTWVALAGRQDHRCQARSLEAVEGVSFDVMCPDRGAGWGEYLKAVAWAMSADGLPVVGWDGMIHSDLPMGGGLSSSAALELACARAFALAASLAWDGRRMAAVCQRAESSWVGVQCGIMDQMAVAEGRAGHAMLIDCRDLELRYFPLPPGYEVVVMDTGTRRDLAASAYNSRQSECLAAARMLEVASLRDADLTLLEASAEGMPKNLVRRAMHVITENARTRAAAMAMAGGDARELGRLMRASHASLRDDFEVSTPYLDAIVELAENQRGCAGARLTGAGFGGCAVALVDSEEAAGFCDDVAEGYARATGTVPSLRVCAASDGVVAVPWPDANSLLPT